MFLSSLWLSTAGQIFEHKLPWCVWWRFIVAFKTELYARSFLYLLWPKSFAVIAVHTDSMYILDGDNVWQVWNILVENETRKSWKNLPSFLGASRAFKILKFFKLRSSNKISYDINQFFIFPAIYEIQFQNWVLGSELCEVWTSADVLL